MIAFLVLLSIISAEDACCDARSLFAQAREAENGAMYISADSLYRSGFLAAAEEDSPTIADSCRLGSYRMQRIMLEFPYTMEEADSLLSHSCPWLSPSERRDYFDNGDMDHLDYQGSRYYFLDCVQNLLFRKPDLLHEYGRRTDMSDPFYHGLEDVVLRPEEGGYPHLPWKPLSDPVEFLVQGSMTIPRDSLPESGLLRIWVPVPVQSSAQTHPRVVSVEPSEYVPYPATTDGSIGTIYMEVPLSDLSEDLDISISTIHSHYTRRCLVDPEMVGEYDTEDSDYILYTGRNDNITWTPEMADLAREIVGSEENPYLQARLIYDYIVESVPYSHVPHMSLPVLGIPEAVFCHERGYGDCGTQSMYFSALCRSLGIPARACGGMQLVPGTEGSHFWAEFRVPGYGWIPVDVTMAETADWSWVLTRQQRDTFKQFFFANLDPFRMVIQRDVNIPVSPPAEEPLAMATAIQFPAMVCKTSIDDPSVLAAMNWSTVVTPLNR